MKKRILASMLALIAFCLLIGGATFALFTSNASNTGNTLSAASLEIDAIRDMGDRPPGPMFYTTLEQGGAGAQNPTGEWAPGDTNERHLNVINKSRTIKAKLTRIKAIVNGIDPQSEAYLTFVNNLNLGVSVLGVDLIAKQPLANYLGNGAQVIVPSGTNAPKAFIQSSPSYPTYQSVTDIAFSATLDGPGTGNALQGQTPTVSFVVYTEQAHD